MGPRIVAAAMAITVAASAPPVAAGELDTIGMVDPTSGEWHLRDPSGVVTSFVFGDPGDRPMMGDWDCDGVDTPGLYRQSDGFVYLRNANSTGVADITFFFGNPSDIPLAGDFDGDGCDTVSLYRPGEGRVYIINELGEDGAGLGVADLDYAFGDPGDRPFAGDFDGDGVDTIGLHRQSTGLVYLRDTHTPGPADRQFVFGDPGDAIVTGDWGVVDGSDTLALFRPTGPTFYFRYTNSQGIADMSLPWGEPSWLPVSGSFAPPPPPPAPPPQPPPPEPEPDPVVFTAAGDFGANPVADGVLAAIGAEGADFHLAVGDLSYGELTPEAAWCTYVKGFVGATHPFQIVVGNHEDDNATDGHIRNFTPCLPDRMDSVGDYGVEYFFDAGPVRVIMIAADLTVDGRYHDYTAGAGHDWLAASITEAESEGRWTVVGVHKNCITTGTKSCEIGEELMDDLISAGVDLILQGHEHNYQRSHQLRCVDVGVTTPECIADTDGEFVAEVGSVLAIAGWVGRSGYGVDAADPEAGYFDVIAGPNTVGYAPGFLTLTATEDSLSGVWTSVGAPGSDAFVIRR